MNSSESYPGVLPPPDGFEANIVNPSHTQMPNNIALHTVCLTLITLFVAMRIYTRWIIIKVALGVDDCKLNISNPL